MRNLHLLSSFRRAGQTVKARSAVPTHSRSQLKTGIPAKNREKRRVTGCYEGGAAINSRSMQPPSSPCPIVLLREEDAPEIVGLESNCFSSGWTEEQYRRLLKETDRALQNGLVPSLVLWGVRCSCHALAGYISLGVYSATGELELFNLAVRQEHRRNGSGRALLLHAFAWGREKGFEKMLLEVRERNLPAVALYASTGFVPLGRRKSYYRDTGEDAIVMARFLADDPTTPLP